MKGISFSCIAGLLAHSAFAFELPHQAVVPYDCIRCNQLSHLPLSNQWGVVGTSLTAGKLPLQQSKKSILHASIKQLKEGFVLHTEAPGAIIRISPVLPNQEPFRYTLKAPNHQIYSLEEASQAFADRDDLNESVFAGKGTTITQLKPGLGSGRFILKVQAGQASDDAQMLIHIYQPNSAIYLQVETDQARYKHGDPISCFITLRDDVISYPIDDVEATLISPDGIESSMRIEMEREDRYLAKATILSQKDYNGENWYINVKASAGAAGGYVDRFGHLAISYAIPSAAVRTIERENQQNPYQLIATLDVATGSRYALQAVLFATNDKGKKIPVQTVQSADWLAPGEQTIHLAFDQKALAPYQAPYYLGEIHLVDYGQLKTVFEYNSAIDLNKLDS